MKKKKKMIVRVMDIKYDNAYNPEGVSTNNKREFRFIVDGDGVEKLLVEEEINSEE